MAKVKLGDRKALEEAVKLLDDTTEGTPAHAKLQQRLAQALTSFGNTQCAQRGWSDCAWALCRAWEVAPPDGKPEMTTVRTLRDGALRLGEWPEGALELGGDGRVRSRGDDGAAIVVGSTLERFLAALMVREGLLVDYEGEFKDVFDEEGVEDKVRAKQTRAALKVDGEAAAWHLEAAESAFDEGDDAAAEAALARAVALDEGAGDAWALLGALQRRSK